MARSPRARYPDAIYHVFDHALGGESLFRDDADRSSYRFILGRSVRRRKWRLLAWCLMDNHVHLMLRAPEGNLSAGMGELKGWYATLHNRRHRRRGPLFRAPFGSLDIVRETHLLEVARYIVLNPVKAGMARGPGDWPWSSYRETIGRERASGWLDRGGGLDLFRECPGGPVEAYREFVRDGIHRRTMDWSAAVERGSPGARSSRARREAPAPPGEASRSVKARRAP